MPNTYSQFSLLVGNYRRYRPTYPPQLIEILARDCSLLPDHIIADIGSGTGILTRPFLENGNRVYAIEPNDEMRLAAGEDLSAYPTFTSISAVAESTTLADSSVHLITAGEAFHYFDLPRTRAEFLRILKPNGWVALAWNVECNSGGPFSTAFEDFWHTYVDAQHDFRPDQPRPDFVSDFFGSDFPGSDFSNLAHIHQVNIDNPHLCDFNALKGRILSSHRVPQPGESGYERMLDALLEIFSKHQTNGTVTFEYKTHFIYGHLNPVI